MPQIFMSLLTDFTELASGLENKFFAKLATTCIEMRSTIEIEFFSFYESKSI